MRGVSNKHCLLTFFIVPEANLIPLLTFELVQFGKFHFHRSFFPRDTGLGTDILLIKLELYCALAIKKNQYPTGICLLPKWKRNGPNGMQ